MKCRVLRTTQLIAASLLSLGLAGWMAGCAAADSESAGHAPPTTAPAASQPATSQPVTAEPAEHAILSDVTQLTHGFDKAGEAYFSPDMKWIIFQASPPGEKNYQMYVQELVLGDGKVPPHAGHPWHISPKNSRNTCGYFSPDGNDLIFASTAGKEDPDEPSSGYQRQGGTYRWDFPKGMEIYRAQGWKTKLQSTDSTPDVDLAKPENRLTENNAYDAEGAYSPDGKFICFTSLRTDDSEVYVMRSDGSHPVQITHAKGYDGGPFFAPDGKRLVYRSDRKGNDLLQIFVADLAFDADGNVTGLAAEHQLTDDGNVNWGPYWYPDDHHLIFATSRQGHTNYELYSMRDDGTHVTRITYCAGFDGLPVFSPDGKWLMWTSKRSPNNTSQIFVARFTPPADW